MILKKDLISLKLLIQTDEDKVLKPKVLDNVGDLNDLCYIYKDTYNEEVDGLNTKKNKKLFYCKKLRPADDYQYESEEEKEEKEQQTSKKPDKKEPLKKLTKEDWIKFNEWVNEKERDINSEIFQRYFNYQRPRDMLKDLYKINDKYNNNGLANLIKIELSDLKQKIKNINEVEKEIEKPNEIIYIVEKILEFNKQNQQGQGLKILTTYQMLSRLPINLAQSKAGNNSQKLKNEIRQLLHSLNRSKNLQNNSIYVQLALFIKMETIFMNTENSKTNEPDRFRLSLAYKRNLKNPNKNIALGNLSIYYTWKNIKSAYNNNKFKISAPTWNDTFDLPDGSYSIADIQDYFEFISKYMKL